MTRLPAEKRREQLLDTAAKLFAIHGFAGATTAQIARAAGVTEPIIYRHFKSKRDLFVALIERTGADAIRLWEHELRDYSDPADRLKRLIGSNPMVTNKGRGLYRVILQAMTETEDPLVQRTLHKHISTLHGFLEREVLSAQESGKVSKRYSPSLTAWALINIGLGYGLLSSLGLDQHSRDSAGHHIQDLLGELMLGERYRRPGEGNERDESRPSQPPAA